jgi:dienelactone hydrolase
MFRRFLVGVRREMSRSCLFPVFAVMILCLGGQLPAFAGTLTKAHLYKIGDREHEGLLTIPDGPIRGGVLVVHNWMGVTDETRKQAERFAAEGFLVLSADIYGKGVRPQSPQEAGVQAGRFKGDRPLFRKNLVASLSELAAQGQVKGKPLVAAGYCFGGTGVIELARSGAELAAVLSFHGGLDSPEPLLGKEIRTRVIAFHGADDPYVKSDDLAAFEKEMMDNKIDWQLVKFGGAVHSFTDVGAGVDPSKGAAYNERADMRSWEMTRSVLNTVAD